MMIGMCVTVKAVVNVLKYLWKVKMICLCCCVSKLSLDHSLMCKLLAFNEGMHISCFYWQPGVLPAIISGMFIPGRPFSMTFVIV